MYVVIIKEIVIFLVCFIGNYIEWNWINDMSISIKYEMLIDVKKMYFVEIIVFFFMCMLWRFKRCIVYCKRMEIFISKLVEE